MMAHRSDRAALNVSERAFSIMFRFSPIPAGICRFDTDLYVDVNDAFVALFEFSREEIIGHSSKELGLWPNRSQRHVLINRIEEEGIVREFEAKYRTKSGSTGDSLISAAIIDLNGQRYLFGMIMELALRESEERHRLLFKNAGDGMMVVSPDFRILAANDAVCTQLGYTHAELLGMTIPQIVTDEIAPRLPSIREGVQKQGKMIFESSHRRKDGSLMPVEAHNHIIDWNGQEACLVICRDLTDRKQTEERLRQSQKMEAIGHLTGGMAHEFNNILASMLMNLSLIKMGGTKVDQQALLTDLEEGCQRSANLIKQLLAFSRQSVMDPQLLDLAEVVRDQIMVLRPLLGEGIEWKLEVPDELPSVRADKPHIEQMLQNLCLNARDAMKQGGRIKLELGLETVGAERTKTHAEARVGQYLRLTVADTGCGMDERTMKRLFEPFFTTKEIGQGTGLGLATARGIVQQHHGWVEVDSHPGKGSTFRIYLPVAGPVKPEIPEVSVIPSAPAGSGTILVVEDNKRLRELTGQVLLKRGYRVFEASDGAAAMAIWAEHRAEINLLYTDMVLPGLLSGLQVAEQVRREKPDLMVIITSGYNTDIVDIESAKASSIIYLPKPCPPEMLLDVIKRSLG